MRPNFHLISLLWLLFLALQLAHCLPPVGLNDLYNLRATRAAAPRNQSQQSARCGYKSCPRHLKDKINVHVIAHTHDDVGWLKTVDQYYYGTKKRYSAAGVQFILDSVIPQLVMDESKRFIYVEMSFFAKWWRDQEEPMRALVRRLVNEGRLEFTNGGWCMNDEATTTYHSTIEQMTLGLRFLEDNFGACARPKVGWQIDPFGHSSEQASLFGQFGFDGMYFTRIDYRDKLRRAHDHSLDLIWSADVAQPARTGQIFTNIFRDGYDAPDGFCFDVLCKDELLVDNEQSYEFNMNSRGHYFIDYLRTYARAKLTNQLLVPMGGDFQYSAAGQNFKSLDKLIGFVRRNAPDINIFYSTPTCYQLALHETLEATGRQLPHKFDDFMPYDSAATVWWSGYFTSRPAVKLVERETAGLLQTARLLSMRQLISRHRNSTSDQQSSWQQQVAADEANCLRPLWEILGDLQHHDAVTGTEKQHVTSDYIRRASAAWAQCAKFMGNIRRSKYSEFLQSARRYPELRQSAQRFPGLDPVFLEGSMLCPLLNISQCDALDSDVDMRRFLASANLNSTKRSSQQQQQQPTEQLLTRAVLLTAYNPLAQPVSNFDLRLPCNGNCDLAKVRVLDLRTNETVRPLIRLPTPAGVSQLPFRSAKSNKEILFYAQLPPLGSSSYLISDDNTDQIVDEETQDSAGAALESSADSLAAQSRSSASSARNSIRTRRVRQQSADEQPPAQHFDYFYMREFGSPQVVGVAASVGEDQRSKREAAGAGTGAGSGAAATAAASSGSSLSHQSSAERVVVKFDMNSGVIVGLRRASDGKLLNITQKFGFYFPAETGPKAGAYIFRPNASEPQLLEKPIDFKVIKRQNGTLIEIHQKWADWIWQTIRVDSKKNYIEFDYLVGPIQVAAKEGREVITRYQTNLANENLFFTDSMARQLMARQSRRNELEPEDLGANFYPVGSTLLITGNNRQRRPQDEATAEAVAILVDRAQAATSLNEGDLELLLHRRLLKDDNFGVAEALDEPGEDGRGLVTRGKHRLYLKFGSFQDSRDSKPDDAAAPHTTPRLPKPKLLRLLTPPAGYNLTHEKNSAAILQPSVVSTDTSAATREQLYLVHDQLFDDLRQESIRYALKPVVTFDRLRVSADQFVSMMTHSGSLVNTDFSLLNSSLPNNVHLLTLQPWQNEPNKLLIRLENIDNPLLLAPYPNRQAYELILDSYLAEVSEMREDSDDICHDSRSDRVEVDIEHLIKWIRIYHVEELRLGANVAVKQDKRLNWTSESAGQLESDCDHSPSPNSIKLAARQIRTFLATFEFM